MIRDHFTTYQASRNRFSAIIFLYYLHYGGIFLAHFLITVVLNKVSSLRIVFSLCARIGRCDFCTEFTDLIKVELDVMRCLYGIFNTRNFRKTINSFARSPYISSFLCVHFGDKNADRDQNCSLYFIYFQHSGVYTH